MLRMYLLQCWFRLSDESVEDAIYDSYAFRKFMRINFPEEDRPDATTLLHFRYLLEENGLNKLFFEAINRVMVASGHMMKGGTIVDAAIIDAPSSTKNAEKKRNPERYIEHQKSSVRCKAEHAFRIIKRQLGFRKVPYRGLAKNENRLYVLFASANLYVLALAARSSCKAQ